MSGKEIHELPESIGNLSNLTELYLSGNRLENLPESLGSLSNLTRLNLWGNQLTNLPESIGNLANLTELYLDKNPLQEPPLELATKGVQEINEYFQKLREKGKDYLYEAKLLDISII